MENVSAWQRVQYTATRSSDACIARGGHATVHVNGFAGVNNLLVTFGGADAFGVTSNELRLFDVDSATTWTLETGATGPAPRCSHALVVKSCSATRVAVVLYGGVTYLPAQTIFGDIWCLEMTAASRDDKAPLSARISAQWTQVTEKAAPGPRHSFASCVPMPGTFLLTGGCARPPTDEKGPCEGGLFLLDLVKMEWKDCSADATSLPRCEMATAAAVDTGTVLLSGGHTAVMDETGELVQALCVKVFRIVIDTVTLNVKVTTVAEGPEHARVAHTAISLPEEHKVLLLGGQAPANPDEPLASSDVTIDESGVLSAQPRLEQRQDASMAPLFFGLGASVCRSEADVFVLAGLAPDEAGAPFSLYRKVTTTLTGK